MYNNTNNTIQTALDISLDAIISEDPQNRRDDTVSIYHQRYNTRNFKNRISYTNTA